MANIKITAAQIIALRSATMRDNGSYELTTAKGQTVNALTRMGVVVSGTRFLTVQGVSVMHAVSDVSVIASKGHTTYVSNSPESLEMFTLPERESESVEIQGDSPETWAPDFLAVGARECYFGCGSAVVAVFVDYVGRTEGLCATHRDRVEGETYDVPATSQTDAESVSYPAPVIADGMDTRFMTSEEKAEAFTRVERDQEAQNTRSQDMANAPESDWMYDVNGLKEDDSMTEEFVPMDRTGDGITSVMTVAVIQNTPGMSGVTHYHTPGCRDIQREMRKYGQRPSDAFENGFDTVAEILEFEFGDIASDNADSYTPEWWAEIFYNATGDEFGGVKIMPCLDIPNGETSDGSPIIRDGHFYRAGFKRPSAESVKRAQEEIDAHNVVSCDERECVTCWAKLNSENPSVPVEYDESARKFPCLMVGGIIMHKGECAQSTGVNGPVCSLENDETEDAGFVETDSVDDYSIVSRLSTGAGFHTVTEESTSTGTTHHTMDAHGGQWTRFEHVLSVGDIVRSTETGRTLYEVYALISGLPVVYVDPCDGREPFPMGATTLYAL